MEKQTDDKVAIGLYGQCGQSKFTNLKDCSFDKGFYSPYNKLELRKELDSLVLPKKGKRNRIEHEEETSKIFIQTKQKHSAVKSDRNPEDPTKIQLNSMQHLAVKFKRFRILKPH